jgi:hypothetical protein
MKPLDPGLASLMRGWIEKAEARRVKRTGTTP